MTPQLSKQPKSIPSLDDMVVYLGRPPAKDLAKSLGVDESQMARWLKANDAPRPVLLSLFWLTHWGQQWVNTDLYNLANIHMSMNGVLQKELAEARELNKRLHMRIEKLGTLGDFGSANDPVTGVSGPGPKQPAPMLLTFEAFSAAEPAKRPAKAARRAKKGAPALPAFVPSEYPGVPSVHDRKAWMQADQGHQVAQQNRRTGT